MRGGELIFRRALTITWIWSCYLGCSCDTKCVRVHKWILGRLLRLAVATWEIVCVYHCDIGSVRFRVAICWGKSSQWHDGREAKLSKPRSGSCQFIYVREPGEYGKEISSKKEIQKLMYYKIQSRWAAVSYYDYRTQKLWNINLICSKEDIL